MSKDYTDSPFAAEAKQACPWRDTDHRQPGDFNGDTYCTWCEGYVAGAEAQQKETP